MDTSKLDELARRLAASLPENLAAARRELETNFRAVLRSGLAKLDLVTREEFDAQQGVLRRTREKLEALERQVSSFAPRASEDGREEVPKG